MAGKPASERPTYASSATELAAFSVCLALILNAVFWALSYSMTFIGLTTLLALSKASSLYANLALSWIQLMLVLFLSNGASLMVKGTIASSVISAVSVKDVIGHMFEEA